LKDGPRNASPKQGRKRDTAGKKAERTPRRELQVKTALNKKRENLGVADSFIIEVNCTNPILFRKAPGISDSEKKYLRPLGVGIGEGN